MSETIDALDLKIAGLQETIARICFRYSRECADQRLSANYLKDSDEAYRDAQRIRFRVKFRTRFPLDA